WSQEKSGGDTSKGDAVIVKVRSAPKYGAGSSHGAASRQGRRRKTKLKRNLCCGPPEACQSLGTSNSASRTYDKAAACKMTRPPGSSDRRTVGGEVTRPLCETTNSTKTLPCMPSLRAACG